MGNIKEITITVIITVMITLGYHTGYDYYNVY